MEYYSCILTTAELVKYVKTEKIIDSSLNNISILNQNEYLSLYSHLISLCSSSNFTIRFMGACYLILMHEKNPILFKNNFLSAFKMSEISVKSPDYDDDFYDVGSVLVLCDMETYRQFLKISFESSVQEIRKDAKNYINDTLDDYVDSIWYKKYSAEYIEFKRKLNLENS